MDDVITVDQVREMLFRACETAGSQKAWAEHFGISGSYVSDVLKGRRDPGDGILVALGLRKIVTYERTHAPCHTTRLTRSFTNQNRKAPRS